MHFAQQPVVVNVGRGLLDDCGASESSVASDSERERKKRSAASAYVRVSMDEVEAEAGAIVRKADKKLHAIEDGARIALAGDIANVHFLGQELVIDDNDATIVLVFPRDVPEGALKLEELVYEPLSQANDIFVRQHNEASQETMEAGFETFMDGPVTRGHYFKVVRAKLLELFRKSGMKVSTFNSIDGDETFVKLSLDRKGEVIKHYAQRFTYSMQFTEQAYEKVKPHGIYPGHTPMKRNGKPVAAYGPYDMEIAEHMKEFSPVDEVRILMLQLHSVVSLEQLRRQGVIKKYFPAAKHEDVQLLHRRWLQSKWLRDHSSSMSVFTKVFEIPRYGTKGGLIRNFFGEEIAFFFRWFAFYTQMLGVLGVFGVLWWLLKDASKDMRRVYHIAFCGIMVVWATVFNQLFRNRMARAQQEWGMQDFELAEMSFDRADYRPELEGTWKQFVHRVFSIFLCALFCFSFIALVSGIETRRRTEFEEDGLQGRFFIDHGSLIVVTAIKATSIAWGYVAPVLCRMQNHRTQARFDDGLTTMLACVKIFVTLWNFVYHAFVKGWASPTCAATLEEAAARVWGESAYSAANETLRASALAELGKAVFSYNRTSPHHGTLFCVRGCFPETPEQSHPAAETNCYHVLRKELCMFFFVHVLYTVFFLVFPMLKVKFDMLWELRKAKKLQKHGEVEVTQYSWLQFQAKCPTYEYLSWGGSRVEDFLECAIGFALITCFGILFPLLAFFAFLANLVEYRLLAYRMTHVTCRPMPNGASGIGTWQFVFESTSTIAVVVNVLLIVFVMYPLRSQSLKSQFFLFIVMEHVLLGIRYLIDIAIPDVPLDVRRIEDFNTHFRRTMVKYPPLSIPEGERYEAEYKKVDLGLRTGEGLELDFEGSEVSGVDSEETSSEDAARCGECSPFSCCPDGGTPMHLRPL